MFIVVVVLEEVCVGFDGWEVVYVLVECFGVVDVEFGVCLMCCVVEFGD